MSGALDGIRVIDFGQYIAGPLTAMMLGDQGAEVIRVDPPGGPMLKTPANAVWNRGKQSIVLNLKENDDRSVAENLIASADVVIENFRPGVMQRFGLDAGSMTGKNGRLVYCSIPGFSADDPRAAMPGFDGLIGAATELFRPSPVIAGRQAVEVLGAASKAPQPGPSNDRPVYTRVPIPSNFAAFQAVVSIVMALIARERDGLGQIVEVSLFDAVYDAISDNKMNPHGTFSPENGAPAPTTWDIPFLRHAGTRHRCKDGRWVDFWPVNPRFIAWFVDAAGVSDWREAGFLDRTKLARDSQLQSALKRKVAELFMTRSAAQWEKLGKDAGIPLCMHRTGEEWLQHEHARASKTVVEVEDPEFGRMTQPGFPVTLSATPGSTSPRHTLDADRRAILDALVSRPKVLAGQRPRKPLATALEGMRVVDVAQVIAGPTAGRVLADFGAEVIKINNPVDSTPPDHLLLNRGKRTALLDIAKPDGLKILGNLIERADVFIHNFTRGQAEKLGFGYAQVAVGHPDLVYCAVSAYNHDGPWGAGRGYEPLGQATTGIQSDFGGPDAPFVHPLHRITDFGTGHLGAFAIALALFHRLRGGRGQYVQASLAQTGTFHQTPYLYNFAGKVWDGVKGQNALGEGPLYRLYRAQDRWFFFAAKPQWLSTAHTVEGLDRIGSLSGVDLERFLEARFASQTAEVWVERLRTSGAGAQLVQTIEEMLEEPRAHARGLSVWQEYRGRMVRTVGPPPRLSRTPVQPVRLPKPYGGDTGAVLAELGLSQDRIAVLESRGIAVSKSITGSENVTGLN